MNKYFIIDNKTEMHRDCVKYLKKMKEYESQAEQFLKQQGVDFLEATANSTRLYLKMDEYTDNNTVLDCGNIHGFMKVRSGSEVGKAWKQYINSKINLFELNMRKHFNGLHIKSDDFQKRSDTLYLIIEYDKELVSSNLTEISKEEYMRQVMNLV